MTKLELVKNSDGGFAGDFVHAGQTMSGNVGFKCVSRLWYDKTISISEGIDKIGDDAKTRQDVVVSPKAFNVVLDQNNDIAINVGGTNYKPTEHAWGQICHWFDVPSTYYKMAIRPKVIKKTATNIDQRDKETIVSVFQNGQRKIETDKEFLFRIDANGNCRAMLTDRYGIINNVWYLETLAKIFKQIGGDEPRLSHWRGNSDSIYGNVLIPDTCRAESDSDYGGMLSVSNCEIGTRRYEQLPSIFRAICMNGCIHSQVKGVSISKVHRGKIDWNDLAGRTKRNIHSQIPLMASAVDRFLETKNLVLPQNVNVNQMFANMVNVYKLAPQVAVASINQFNMYERNDNNMFGIINAITRAGQTFDNKSWVECDTLGGDLMNIKANKWEYLTESAAKLDDESMMELLELAV